MPVLAPKAQPSTASFRWRRSSSIATLPPQILATPDCVDRLVQNEIQFLAGRTQRGGQAAHAQAPRRKAHPVVVRVAPCNCRAAELSPLMIVLSLAAIEIQFLA